MMWQIIKSLWRRCNLYRRVSTLCQCLIIIQHFITILWLFWIDQMRELILKVGKMQRLVIIFGLLLPISLVFMLNGCRMFAILWRYLWNRFIAKEDETKSYVKKPKARINVDFSRIEGLKLKRFGTIKRLQ